MVSTSRVLSYDPSLVVPVVDKVLREGTPEAELLPEDCSLDMRGVQRCMWSTPFPKCSLLKAYFETPLPG